MSELKEKTGIWFVYDGECPICQYAAEAMRMKQAYGSLSLLNAREAADDPLIEEINRRGLDLDEGMVIYLDGRFYHGKQALMFMARYGTASNGFMSAVKLLFWSKSLALIFYPWMRGARNFLLKRKRVGRIDNLNAKQEPIFASVFGDQWQQLPPVMKKHYANHPYSNEVHIVEGMLNVFCRPPLVWLSPLLKRMGQIPPFNDTDVRVTVKFESDLDSKSFHFNRTFYFKGRKPHVFHSRMLQAEGNEVMEMMSFGLVWKSKFFWDGEKVVLSHSGYAVRLLGHVVPLPITWLLGAGNAIEVPVDDETFDMQVNITHPWWGEIYGYHGRFVVQS